MEHSNDAFELFLKHTDEKRVLLEGITRIIDKNHPASLLDIGAGNGELSIPISQKVSRYVAVEPDKKFADALTKAGLEVVAENFPTPLYEKFDMVLSIHSAYFANDLEEFITSAWNLVNAGGSLVVVIMQGDKDPLRTRLAAEFNDKTISYSVLPPQKLLSALEQLGEVHKETLLSHVSVDSVEQAVLLLPFIASDAGAIDKKRAFGSHKTEIEAFIEHHYKTDHGVSIPLEHLVLSVRK